MRSRPNLHIYDPERRKGELCCVRRCGAPWTSQKSNRSRVQPSVLVLFLAKREEERRVFGVTLFLRKIVGLLVLGSSIVQQMVGSAVFSTLRFTVCLCRIP
ncbi:hypothetical protein Q1695_006658 [Nippostrongylus brasiliensis]|nr:hypothetical protein Q1695_006658 [Nippostrongylus brasiliensis]